MDIPVCHCICTAAPGSGPRGRKGFRLIIGFIFLLSITTASAAVPSLAQTNLSLADLSLEELAMLPVISVSKTAKPVASAPASIFVLTERAVRRSGATTLPEALRLAPNLQVARLDAGNYAISARGFNGQFSNKLLVMVDGRTVYTPLFSGVFWDAQDVMLEDLDRIEVVSGPGGTMWGANAVNGVINVVTRSAAETQGALLSIGGSGIEQHGAVRYGSKFGATGSYRVYAKHSQYEAMQTAYGIKIPSVLERSQVGFRTDWGSSEAAFTVQGDAYNGQIQTDKKEDTEIAGANLLARGAWSLSSYSKVSVQGYFDHTQRHQPNEFEQHLNAIDIEWQHEWSAIAGHTILWGGGYRYLTDDVDNDLSYAFLPEHLNMHWRNIFLQDEISLSDELKLIVGSKWEDNPFTRWENMPSIQLAWEPDSSKLVWASIARAIRAPSRVDRDLHMPGNPPVIAGVPFYFLSGGPNFVAEVGDIFEVGYRSQPVSKVSWSITGFFGEYNKLRTLEPMDSGFGHVFENQAEASTRGIEMWGGWQAADKWRWHAGLVLQDIDKTTKSGSEDITEQSGLAANDPRYYGYLRSSYDISDEIFIDSTLRHVDELKLTNVPAYTEWDLRVAWAITPDIELSIVGQNLLKNSHAEFGSSAYRSEHERSFYGKLVWGL